MPTEKAVFTTMYNFQDTAGNDILLIEQQLSIVFSSLRKAQGNSIQMRKEFLNLLAQDWATRLGTDSTVEIENMKQSEESKRLAQHHGYIMKGDSNGALREVIVPVLSIGEGQEWTTIRDENEMY